MSQIAIIIFREILEIALILSILFGATKGVKNRSLWINGGLILGLIGSVIFATLTDQISDAFEGQGQEIFSAGILFLASLMIGYTVIWMKNHSKALAQSLKSLGKKVVDGEKELYVLLVIVALSVLREGAEIVLFTYSYYMAGLEIKKLISGVSLGLTCGLIVGFGFYFGLLKTSGKYFFSITTTILAFLCAGLMAQSLSYLANAGLIGEIKSQMWDSSFLIADDSVAGTILNILTGYVAKPSALQLIGYIGTLLILFTLSKINNKPVKHHSKS